jgi:hypothetical protein
MTGLHKPHEDRRLVAALLPRCSEFHVELNALPNGLLLSVLPPGAPPGRACEPLGALARALAGGS